MPHLTRKWASAYLLRNHGLKVARVTLAKLAVSGGGPLYRKVGRETFYSTSSLDDWAHQKLGPAFATVAEHEAYRAAGKSVN